MHGLANASDKFKESHSHVDGHSIDVCLAFFFFFLPLVRKCSVSLFHY